MYDICVTRCLITMCLGIRCMMYVSLGVLYLCVLDRLYLCPQGGRGGVPRHTGGRRHYDVDDDDDVDYDDDDDDDVDDDDDDDNDGASAKTHRL